MHTITTCARCSVTLVLNHNGNWVTGDASGWILPYHLNNTCDGMNLHQPIPITVGETTAIMSTVLDWSDDETERFATAHSLHGERGSLRLACARHLVKVEHAKRRHPSYVN